MSHQLKEMDSSHASENLKEELETVPEVDGKQSSKRVRMSAAKVPGGTVIRGSTEIPTLAPGVGWAHLPH